MAKIMNRQPLVSIIIPVYNGGNYLKEAINSAIAQTYSNCEIIVVNDGSTDNNETESICLSYGDTIRYFSKKNGGVASAINYGIKQMRGDYFAWLSHDDMFYPTKIEEQLTAISNTNNPESIVFGNFEFLNVQTQEKSCFRVENFCDEKKITSGIYPILFGLIHFCTMLVPKSRIDAVGLCDETLKTTQDIEWIFRLTRNQQTVFLKKPLTIVRLHDMQGKHQIKEYSEEQGYTHIHFLDSVTDKEIVSLFGDKFTFYQQMASFYQKDNNWEAFRYVKDKFNAIQKPDSHMQRIHHLKNYLSDLGENKTCHICVFCAGHYGKNLLYEFKSRDIPVNFFSDNNKSLWHTHINGTICLPPVQIDKSSTLIIVANAEPDALAHELKEKGFSYVVTYHKILPVLLNTPVIYIPDEK